MSYLYCLEVSIETQDDVNALFREHMLKGEITQTPEGTIFLCPQLSHTMWDSFPQSKELSLRVDEHWDEAISDSIAFLEKRYTVSYSLDTLGWKKIDIVYRCSKMEHFVREYDIHH